MNVPLINREVTSFHAASFILAGATLASKLLGLVRDRLLAARFGAGTELDVYYAAFQLPDILYTLLLAGAASAAVLPVLLEHDRRGEQATERFLSNLLTVFSATAVLLVALAWIVAPAFVGVVAPGFDADASASVARLTRIMLGNAFLIGVAGIFSSVLQARHRFFVFALPPVIYNVGIIAGILVAVPRVGIDGVAYGVLAGGALQVLVQLPAIVGLGFRFRPRRPFLDPGLGRVVRTSLPRVLAIAMTQVTLTVLVAIASLFAAGSISAFRLAVNLAYVPVGIFGVSWALAIFPRLSREALARRGESFRSQFELGIRSILFWVLPAAALAVVLRAHIVRIVLGSGAFDWADTRMVAALVAVLAVAVVSESVLPLLLRAFYALGRTAEPLLWDITASLSAILSAGGLALFFVARPDALQAIARVLRIADLAPPYILAVAIAFSFGSLLNAFLLGWSLRRASHRALDTAPSFEFGAIASMAGAAVLGGVAAYGALLPFPALVATNTFAGIFLQGVTAAAVGLAVYAFILATQKNPELAAMIQSFRQRLIRPAVTPRVFDTEKLDGEGPR